ncbi:MAG: SapC family protein [Pseudomonadota bacterium]
MPQIVALDREKHREFKVVKNCATRFAAKQHILNVRAVEVGIAASDMPVFINKHQDTGQLLLSAMASVTPGESLFVDDQGWRAAWIPTTLQTYPVLLVNAPNTKEGYAAGIVEDSEDFSKDDGDPLFDEDGGEAPFLKRAIELLEGDVARDMQTQQMLAKLNELDAIRPVNINVTYGNDQNQTITGLHTVDEEALKSLTGEVLEEMNSKGYLMVAHALLMSLNQVNSIVQRHNQLGDKPSIKQIQLQIEKPKAETTVQ